MKLQCRRRHQVDDIYIFNRISRHRIFVAKEFCLPPGRINSFSLTTFPPDSFHCQKFTVDSGTGLRYAAISGDYNPHHLYPWTARVAGYKQPMAHGMWTLAKALAVVQSSK